MIDEKFMDYVAPEPTTGCWLWLGTRNRDGYGVVRRGSKDYRAHRYSYAMVKGQIPPGLTLDHLCRTPACVNPGHLEPVTLIENINRGVTCIGIVNRRKVAAACGHPFDREIHYRRWNREHLARVCDACHKKFTREKVARHRARKRLEHADGLLEVRLLAAPPPREIGASLPSSSGVGNYRQAPSA